MPSGRQNGEFPFGTIDGEEIEGLVGVVEPANGDDDVSGPYIELRAEGLLEPELLQLHFSALLDFGFPLSGLRELLFHGASGSRVLEFNLRLQAPAPAEVIPYIDDGMGDVKTAVGGIIGILDRPGIAVDIITEEVSRKGGLAVSANRKLLSLNGYAEKKKQKSIIDSLHFNYRL